MLLDMSTKIAARSDTFLPGILTPLLMPIECFLAWRACSLRKIVTCRGELRYCFSITSEQAS